MVSYFAITVIPNRDAATHKRAVKKSKGCRQKTDLMLFFKYLLLRVPQIVIFSWVRVLPNIFYSYMAP
jgi:hypothetical protein